MKKQGILLLALGALMTSNVYAAGGDWLVRLRAVNVNLKDTSTALGTLEVKDKTIPEVDVSYFFTDNIAAELVLTYPQKHDIKLGALGTIGSVKELPPTLLLQYHFAPGGSFDPYVGAGINYTRFSSLKLPADGGSLSKSSIGPALQIGVDIPINDSLSFNVDLKKVWMDTDLTLNDPLASLPVINVPAGTKIKVDLDPVLIGVGLGWKF